MPDQSGDRDEDRNQNENWFKQKSCWITASMAHDIANSKFANGKSETPAATYLDAVLGRGDSEKSTATKWGIYNEGEAIRQYKEVKSADLDRKVFVQKCGLMVHPEFDWLAADPDGIVMDYRTRRQLFCLEVMCPFEHKDHRVEDACRDDPKFCLEMQDQGERQPGEAPVYSLKKSDRCFTQIQCQLAVTGLEQADLVVFTLKELAIVPVTFDMVWWDKILSKLDIFYRGAILPRLSEGRQQERAAASTSEP